MEVLVFKTSVNTEEHVELLTPELNAIIQPPKWNFDLEDCDRILRIESTENIRDRVMQAIKLNGFACEELAG